MIGLAAAVDSSEEEEEKSVNHWVCVLPKIPLFSRSFLPSCVWFLQHVSLSLLPPPVLSVALLTTLVKLSLDGYVK